MRTAGYDNIGFALILEPQEWATINKLCNYKNKGGAIALLKEKIFFEHKGSFVHCTINAPKLLWDSNVELAGPKDLELAIERAQQYLPAFVNLRTATVLSVHFAYTQDTPYDYSLWEECFVAPPRGKWTVRTEENGKYFNGNQQRVICYGKDGQLRAKGKPSPSFEHPHLIRIEHRIDRGLLSQLKGRGLWTLNSIIGSDLCTSAGFVAILKYFEWRVTQFILRPSTSVREISALERWVLKNPHNVMRFLSRECKAGRVSDDDLLEMSNLISTHQRTERPTHILQGISKECGDMLLLHGKERIGIDIK